MVAVSLMTGVGVAGRRRYRLIFASPHRGGGLDSRDVRGGEYEQALYLLTQAHALFNAIGDRDGQLDTLNGIGDLALDHPPGR